MASRMDVKECGRFGVFTRSKRQEGEALGGNRNIYGHDKATLSHKKTREAITKAGSQNPP